MGRLSIVLSLALVGGTQIGSYAGDKWDQADQKVVRLPPRAISQLPERIIAYLEGRRCLVPQTHDVASPHNVIRGEFFVAGQTDLAVLCSVDRVSAILVFRKMSTDGVAEIAPFPDRDMLHGIGDDQIGFSREISTSTPETIRRHPGVHGLPAPNHDGIEDDLCDEASDIWYFHNDAWLHVEAGE